MTSADRERYHQLHPLKLLIDWSTAVVGGGLLWGRHPAAAVVVGFGPSIVVSSAFLSGRFDRALDAIRSHSRSRTFAIHDRSCHPLSNLMRLLTAVLTAS